MIEASEEAQTTGASQGLDVAGVQAGYGDTEVLRGVSLSARRGSVVALLGPNGAGKTTLLNVISGGVAARTGSMTLEGVDITRMSVSGRARRGLCHIPEGRGIFRSLTVRENLEVHASRSRDANLDAAYTAFPVLGMRQKQVAGTLSGGEQQMLALSRAFVTQARYLLLDELSLGLAPIVVEQIFEAIRMLVVAGSTIVLVEQYVERALALADTVVLMSQGTARDMGAANEVEVGSLIHSYLGQSGQSGPG
jgi:branched-chain amino acid transport system ATP-binding protein